MTPSPPASSPSPGPGAPALRIVIVGAGFAGTTLARALRRWRGPAIELTLVSDESYTTFNPMLPEAVGASVFPEQVVVPVREMLRPAPGRRFVMGEVRGVDWSARLLHCQTLAGPQALPWDHLVLAVGSAARLDLMPGMAEHALPLKTVGDAMHIRNTVLRRLARIELETDPALRHELGHFIVVGGGFSGVEVAGELVDCLHSMRRYYPEVAARELKVSVLHGGDRLLPELPPGLGEAAERSLRQRGVAVLLKARAQRVREDGVDLDDGRALAGRTVIATAGVRAQALTLQLGLPLVQGRIVAAADLSVPGHEGVWALGDCAYVPNGRSGQVAPPTAQFAVRQARHLAANLAAAVAGRPTRPFHHRALGMMAAIGHRKGVAQAGPFQLSGLPAWLMWRAYYLSQIPSTGRRLRVFFEWVWGMVTPTDITHLRFQRSPGRLPPAARTEPALPPGAPAARP
ncbi:NAD(P)/FAD-dependent oxidoreductase [Aquariibacter albus]|uniref:NAD(P)/FAD-dependent oxidoreductase n=1 Tax=Aquariibacter albus TaxID=2759899 RepID=A0A839HIQ7_9BURK|nr:NAD(P)/FAD-dependent oxidoreductase [Aquariibacter albus]MBB1160722.1 NAD(P)/FAD-dependent oxidoreductase [Aquariibacter albus]